MKKIKIIKYFIIYFFFILYIFIPKIDKTQDLSLWKEVGLYGRQITSNDLQTL